MISSLQHTTIPYMVSSGIQRRQTSNLRKNTTRYRTQQLPFKLLNIWPTFSWTRQGKTCTHFRRMRWKMNIWSINTHQSILQGCTTMVPYLRWNKCIYFERIDLNRIAQNSTSWTSSNLVGGCDHLNLERSGFRVLRASQGL